MIQDQIHRAILDKMESIHQWFEAQGKGLVFPITSSFDIRDSGFKVGNVDANLFPAGFNNICAVDRESAQSVMASYLERHYGSNCEKILLLTEEHTKNSYYWENVLTLRTIIKGESGREVVLGVPRTIGAPMHVESASGQKVDVFSTRREGGSLVVGERFVPDLIVCNNDFSVEYPGWGENLEIPVNPPTSLGWYKRKKSRYFEIYNRLAGEFATIIGIDPWLIQANTKLLQNFDQMGDSSEELSDLVEEVLSETLEKYRSYAITQKPFVFIKNNSGTYGLGITRVYSGQEVKDWNYKIRKKMKASKGGAPIREVIVQEGVPSVVAYEGAVAEPTIYMVGCRPVGGFLRSHSQKDPTESLNSPGALFRRLCLSDLAINVEGLPMENVYGWIAKIATLALGIEAKSVGAYFGLRV